MIKQITFILLLVVNLTSAQKINDSILNVLATKIELSFDNIPFVQKNHMVSIQEKNLKIVCLAIL